MSRDTAVPIARAVRPAAPAGGTSARGLMGLVLVLLLALVSTTARGHAVEQSYVFLRISDARIAGQFELGVPELNEVLGLSLPVKTPLTPAQLGAIRDRVVDYVHANVRLSPGGQPAQIHVTGIDSLLTSFTQFVVVNFHLGDLDSPARYLDVDYDIFFDELPGHRAMLVIAENWKTGTLDNESQVSLVFDPDERSKRLDLAGGSLLRGLVEMVKLGVHHILIGIDHILFLLALLLACVLYRDKGAWEPVARGRSALWNVVKIVTLFTIAHSITLALAATGVVQPPSRLVESVIAFSIAIVALDILVPILHRYIGLTVFVFGLFHGFGFASVLGEMGVPREYLVLSLLGFNIGVELGQIGIVLLVFPALYWLRTLPLYRRRLLPAGAVGLIVVASYWFVERAFDVDLPAGAMLQAALGVKL